MRKFLTLLAMIAISASVFAQPQIRNHPQKMI